MTNFTNQHKAIEVLLGRFMRTRKINQRATLSHFVSYLKTNKDVKTQMKGFGHHRLHRVVSHALEAGAYSDFRLSMGVGIVPTNYAKQLRFSTFEPTLNQRKRLGL